MSAPRQCFAALTLALLGVGRLSAEDKNEPLPKDLATAKVVVTDLQPKIVERGSLEARDNNFVRCEVKAGTRGALIIKSVVEDGSRVKKGDLILELDDSFLKEQAEVEKIRLEKAKVDVDAAEKLLKLKKEAKEVREAEAELRSKHASLDKQEASYKDILEQIGKCKIKAPAAGILVYYVPEQSRFPRGQQPIIAQGEPVQYGQKLVSIPDLSHMLVKVRIAESVITQVKVGLPCEIVVEAFPGKRIKGVVKSVAAVAEQASPFSPDVKVYQTILEFTDPVQDLNLKPDLTALCEIITEARAVRVLAVPIKALLPPLAKGKKARCLIVTERGPEACEIEVGRSDGRIVEIKSGLKEGDEVVIDQRVLSRFAK